MWRLCIYGNYFGNKLERVLQHLFESRFFTKYHFFFFISFHLYLLSCSCFVLKFLNMNELWWCKTLKLKISYFFFFNSVLVRVASSRLERRQPFEPVWRNFSVETERFVTAVSYVVFPSTVSPPPAEPVGTSRQAPFMASVNVAQCIFLALSARRRVFSVFSPLDRRSALRCRACLCFGGRELDASVKRTTRSPCSSPSPATGHTGHFRPVADPATRLTAFSDPARNIPLARYYLLLLFS